MSEWLDVVSTEGANSDGPWEFRVGIGDPMPCLIRECNGIEFFSWLYGEWRDCRAAGHQFRRLHTGTKEEVETGKAVAGLMERLVEQECDDLRNATSSAPRGVIFTSTGECRMCLRESGDFADSLPALLEQLTKPLEWKLKVDSSGNDYYWSPDYCIGPQLRDNIIWWKPDFAASAVYRTPEEAKDKCQEHHDSQSKG